MAYRILIVDDSAAMRNFIGRVLDLSGLPTEQVFQAADGNEALATLDREWVDVILTDINMPGMNGEEFVRRLSESGATVSTPVIVVSTDNTSVRKERLAALGARGYLVKPFSPEMLHDAIEQALQKEETHA